MEKKVNLIKRIGLAAGVFALAALTSGAKADTWQYKWDGSYTGQVSALNAVNGNGGFFHSTLTDTTTHQMVAYGSYCNELGQDITTNPVTPIAVDHLTSLSAGELQQGTYDANNVLHKAQDAKLGQIAWLVAQHWSDVQNWPVNDGAWNGNNGGNQNVGEQALQLAVWNLWGFTNISAFDTGNDAGVLAKKWVSDSGAYSNYTNNNVLWVRMAQDGNGNPTAFQDQIMYVVTPEASSSAPL